MMQIGDSLKQQMKRRRIMIIREHEQENLKIYKRLFSSQSHYNAKKMMTRHDKAGKVLAQRLSQKNFVLNHSPAPLDHALNDKLITRMPPHLSYE